MELYIGKQHGEIGLEDAETLLAKYPTYARRGLSSAMKSEGYRLKDVIRQTIRQGGPNGSWPKLNPHTGVLNRASKGWVKNSKKSRYRITAKKGYERFKKAKNIYKGYMISTKRAPLLKLAGGTRYTYDPDLMVTEIGFLSGRSPGATTVLAKKHAQGFRVPVTSKSRRWAFGLGFPLKKETTELVIPPRPVVGPVFDAEKGRIVRNISEKTLANIERYASGGSKS
jgi:hypothetical protein